MAVYFKEQRECIFTKLIQKFKTYRWKLIYLYILEDQLYKGKLWNKVTSKQFQ